MQVYPAYDDWRNAIRMAETLDEEALDILFPKYGRNLPNTYVFSKNVTEYLVGEYAKKLPCIIYRPSVGEFKIFNYKSKLNIFRIIQ